MLAVVLLAAPLATSLPASVSDSGTWVQTDKLTADLSPQVEVVEDLEDRPLIKLGEDDWFGESMSLDGDLLAVGAPGDARGDRPGEVYIYERDGLHWRSVTRLAAGVPGDDFGRSLALDDGMLVVGAPSLRGGSADVAYVYERTADGWTLEAMLSEEGTACFGSSVAIEGDTLVVGAPCRGLLSAFIYERTASGWVKVGDIQSPGTFKFGSALALSEDVLVVGGVLGAARVYERAGTAWIQSAVLPIGRSTSVAVSGSTVAVGNIFNLVKVFERGPDGWERVAGLKPPSDGVSEESPFFGRSVAFSGDGTVLAVGAPGDDGTPPGTPPLPDWPDLIVTNPDRVGRVGGAVHVFELGPEGWTHQAKLSGADTRSENSGGDNFGTSVQVSLNGDTVFAGAPRDACCWDPMNGRIVTGTVPIVEGPCGISHFACVHRGEEADAVYAFTEATQFVRGGLVG